MSIFNWRKKKDEEQKTKMMETKKSSVVDVVSSSAPVKDTVVESGSPTVGTDAVSAPRATGDAHRILVRPLITEKNTLHQTQNHYVFEVSPNANKIEVRKAVEVTFKVKVIKVRMVSYRGKAKQFGRMKGTRKNWKKAIVTVGKGDQITLLSSV